MHEQASLTSVKVYLADKSKDELIKKMIAVQIQNGKQYNFECPMWDGKEWVVWYTANTRTDRGLNAERKS